VFPVPKGSQLKKFSMEIDGKLVEAELTLADKARNIYEDIVRKLKDPALLEYAGQDVFKVRIFPIEPRSRKRVSLSYTQLLKADSGLIGYAWSLNSAKFSAKPIPSVGLKIDLQTKRPLKSVYSPSHTVEIRRHGDKKATIGYEARDVRPELGFQLYFATEADDLGVNLMTYKTGSDDGYFLLLASPGVESKGQKVVPKDVVFVLDTSGSMAGKKLDQAKKALLFCVENLNAKDRFEVMRFSTDTESLFGGLSGADKANRRRAEDFINDLKPLGGTAIDDALKKALSLSPGKNSESRIQNPESSIKDPASGIQHPFVIIFLTDGLPTIGNTDENTIVGNVKSRSDGNVRVFCFGIGHDVNTHLLDKITEETRAVSQYVLPEEDIEVKVSGFFAKIKDPVLTNPTLSFTGSIRTSRLYPSPLPDVFQGEQLVLVGRYSGSGSSAATIGGTVDGARRTFSHDVSFPDTASEYDFIPRLWATRRVGYLLEEIRLHGENAELKDEVTELARKYSIVTPYTAYLIVEDEKRREVPMAMQSLPQLQTDTANRDRLGSHYTKLMMERYGLVSVAQSRNELAYKSANVPADAVSTGNTEAQRGLAATAPLSTPTTSTTRGGGRSNGSAPVGRPMVAKDADFTGQTQFVAGRSFYQNNNQWIDASIQKLKDAKRVRVQFGSKEYFDLIATRPETRSWLALGQNVQFALGTTVYEVYN
jgi:Ca-activated chloride channel family protein